MNQEFADFAPELMQTLEQWFDQYPNAKEFKLAGINQFTFTKDQLFDVDENGRI
ncbi:hypothetical protein [Sharpea azabuensis]|uniref:hypothetical protein n=1 Tax=Sharpea azabuensis TaxID=322505 RepID=UPI00156A01F0|nr:hypothetical protein [Sharpea azabuensis]